ncbi:hypothetical protein Ocin01_18234 [Orchesella cincta]|uniref:Uncharacterized protein n=1 Tax=Orchesella cincta TaxID=48709 RepID=A0A1D2M653_ORCCI|nr:hypothetical protein Ocin01_18234 [Orchesella cincta]
MENDSWETNWLVCSSNGMGYTCRMGNARDDCSFQEIQPTDVSVKGLWIFFVSNESPGLAEFRFQERVGDYQPLAPDVAGKVTCLKQTGEPSDYKTPALTLFYQIELITDSLLDILT